MFLLVPFEFWQALITLKKGFQLLIYGCKGKAKFYPFRLSSRFLLYLRKVFSLVLVLQDDKPLILISSSSEKSKLASVSKVVPGKRTVRRHFSFSYESLFFLDLVLKYMV